MRRLKGFEHIEPKNLSEALSFLHDWGEVSAVLAGGTDLLVGLRQGNPVPTYLVNIKKIHELKGVALDDTGSLVIGATTSIREIELSREIRQEWDLLSKAARKMASPHIRNSATVGGNLCNASPAADMAQVLIALGGRAEVIGINGERDILLEDFFSNPGQTSLSKGELLTRVIVPRLPPNTKWTYLKLGVRNAMDIGIVNVAVCITFEDGGPGCKEAKIVLGSVAPTPIRAKRAESLLKGARLDRKMIEEAGVLSVEQCRPMTDMRASAQYRREMIHVMVRRALEKVLETIH